LFLESHGSLWLLDTGSPTSFGSSPITIEGEEFQLGSSHYGLTAANLSELTRVDCAGLLGADILIKFDFVLDAPQGTVELSRQELEHVGETVPLEEFMSIPIVSTRIGYENHPMFFDTGAQLSYFQHDSLEEYPPGGVVTDFYPGVGQFQTETYELNMLLGSTEFVVRTGTLPELLATSLMMAGVDGIVGNQILADRRIGYFPRRRLLVI